MKRIDELLAGQGGSYIFPFFWQHGEEEATLRDYMRAINEANIREVCVECRPHPDFCGPKWWQDMDVILDEAHKRDMKVWILDDDHFPTGHCNGGIENADLSLRPWYVDSVCAECYGPSPANRYNVAEAVLNKVKPKQFPGMPPMMNRGQKLFFENDEEILSVQAWKIDGNGRLVDPIDLTNEVNDGLLCWDVPNGAWRIYVVFLTHNGEGRTDYMNILDHDSVRVLIDEVYEKHYARYRSEFGKTIRGFFSDEPMVGNIAGMYTTGKLGGKKRLTNPWDKELPALLEARLGNDWKGQLALLWNDGEDAQTVAVRMAYMDAVTELIGKNFSGQLAAWCEAHQVEYIGHLWEDKTLSCALGGGLGHYFRGMQGNHMGGVDIVFSSSMKPWSDHCVPDGMAGDFYYNVLGKLASSHASFDPHKKGRAMCESFGATGWDYGVDKMKYMADNLLVSGLNHFVPHAFSPASFPDPDCPPHFYAHGENAQYRHFAKLMEYMQRVCHLLNGGINPAEAAILYPAENDWVSELNGGTVNMPCDVPARLLAQAQIDYQIIPADLLAEGSELKDGKLTANGVSYKALIVPAAEYASEELIRFSHRAKEADFPVLFLERMPKAAENAAGEYHLTEAAGIVVACEELVGILRGFGIGDAVLQPASPSVRLLHYAHENDLYMLVNNDLGQTYDGWMTVKDTGKAFLYDAYANAVIVPEQETDGKKRRVHVRVAAYNPIVVFFGECGKAADQVKWVTDGMKETLLSDFRLSACPATQYPAFGEAVEIHACTDIAADHPDMMDYYRYETEFTATGKGSAVLKMDYISDGTEVWCNDVYCGMRIAPDWVFDLSSAVKPGKNTLRIEVAATPARKVKRIMPGPDMHMMMGGMPSTERPEGIIGAVKLYTKD